jgi:hypothetical protein
MYFSGCNVEGFDDKAKLTVRKASGFREFETIQMALFYRIGPLASGKINPQILRNNQNCLVRQAATRAHSDRHSFCPSIAFHTLFVAENTSLSSCGYAGLYLYFPRLGR